ncbi:MAG TPA: Calx-beta domain-containing protein [Pyrinomonadaceae bacterium]|nr:Calx-beta domain-containing protein [Pyrinomonadaceae bacterium]
MLPRNCRFVLVVALATFFLTNLALQRARSAEPKNAEGMVNRPSGRMSPTSAPQAESHSIRQVSIVTKDVVFDSSTGKLYASVPSRGGATGNSIATINPVTAQVEGTVFVGSEPGKLALSDDGHTLYASLDGSAAVRRYDITTQTAGAQFAVGDGEPFFVKDLAVAPGNPDLVAISRKNLTSSPDFEAVAVYDGGVRRSLTTARHTGSDFIAFSNSASTLYGVSSGGGGLQKMSVSASGVSVVTSSPSSAPGGDFKFQNGFLYLPFGQVFNAETATLTGTFSIPLGGLSVVEPDSSVGRVFFLTGSSAFSDTDSRTLTLRAYNQNTFVPVGTLEIPNVVGQVTSLVRWGANGLAFGTTGGRFYIIQTTLVPSGEPVPTPTPTPSPTSTPSPTPTPTPAPGELREVPISANDIVIDAANQTIFASVPSSAGVGGNSITPVDPISGAVGTPVNIGSEPNKLAISDNGQFIYVGLDGAKAVRRFDVASRTSGLQFSLGGNQQAQFGAIDIAVAPGQPQTVAVVKGTNPNSADGGVALYDDGVQRPNVTNVFHTINVIEYSASPLIFYGHNNSNSEAGFRKLAAASCGISVLSAKGSLLQGVDFKIENGLAYSTSGRVADPEAGTLVGTYPVTTGLDIGVFASAVLADSKAGRVYFFVHPTTFDSSPQTMLIRAFDLNTFLHVGTLAVPNIAGSPRTVVRWGADGFAIRTSANKVYLLETSLIPAQMQTPTPAPVPTPPTYTLRGQVSSLNGPPLPTVTLQLSGGQGGTTTTNPDGSFAFAGLPLCTDFTVTPAPLQNYSFNPDSRTITASDQNNPNLATAFFSAIPNLVGFPFTSLSISEAGGIATIPVTRSGDISSPSTVFYETTDGSASDRSDYLAAIGTLRFGPNEATKHIAVFVTNDVRDEINETFTLTLSSPTGAFLTTQTSAVVTIIDNEDTNGENNPADDAQFFVRQHYRDFLDREPDSAGLAFWVDQITSCATNTQCTEIRRINVSAAFFLSIEFQQTGYLVYRANQAAFNSGEHLDFRLFLPDTQEIGRGVIIGQPEAEQVLETNKQNFFMAFVQRPIFVAPGAYPLTMTAAEFVDKLNANTFDPLNPNSGLALTQTQRDALIAQLSPDPSSHSLRAQVLRSVSENGVFNQRQFNKAFVLMQYFGYLRRNPNAAPDTNFDGYNFWLDKLNEFNGNFVNAEMVKAFITSGEYRSRFGI